MPSPISDAHGRSDRLSDASRVLVEHEGLHTQIGPHSALEEITKTRTDTSIGGERRELEHDEDDCE